jgi:hypothetical protein
VAKPPMHDSHPRRDNHSLIYEVTAERRRVAKGWGSRGGMRSSGGAGGERRRRIRGRLTSLSASGGSSENFTECVLECSRSDQPSSSLLPAPSSRISPTAPVAPAVEVVAAVPALLLMPTIAPRRVLSADHENRVVTCLGLRALPFGR